MNRSFLYFLVALAGASVAEKHLVESLIEGIDYRILNDSAFLDDSLVDHRIFQQVVPPEGDFDGGFWQVSLGCQLENVMEAVKCLYDKEGHLLKNPESDSFRVQIEMEDAECDKLMASPKCFSSYLETGNGTVILGVQYVKSFSKRNTRFLPSSRCRGVVSTLQKKHLARLDLFCGLGWRAKRPLQKKIRRSRR
ncbi:hypothetical protein QR680_005818 [Steinernema hermaphroditum]|uniref:Uncharacterized protein n=1 Tax=Steinernema hermaphroditum TaxID=289476 RepID=A0AA39HUU0_9BILA|nr:hypothetical protein QR680_005818 [Steinernema hermaphroditum]